jgi:hypothetical protein
MSMKNRYNAKNILPKATKGSYADKLPPSPKSSIKQTLGDSIFEEI